MRKPVSTACSQNLRGFSMVEMLIVIAVIGLLIAISVPAISPMVKASKINKAGDMITGEFNYARQTAMSRNTNVEVRFYQLGSSSDAGDLQYRAFRTVLTADTNPSNDKALTPLKFLPEPVIISDDASYSSLLDYSNASRSGLKKSQDTLPRISGSVEYISFTFKPDGSTSLNPITPPLGNWFLTLYAKEGNPAMPPANYFNVQLDPVTGRCRTHRP